MTLAHRSALSTVIAVAATASCIGYGSAAMADSLTFTAGDLVVSIEGDGSGTGTYTDNQAAPLTLQQFALNGTTSATAAGSMMLPTTSSGANYAISGEYGSSSEGTLQLSGNGQYLTIMGYGVNPDAFNANPGLYGPTGNKALGQSYAAAAPRVVALIGANGSVDTSTALTNVFDQNNPRSAYTVDGSSFYVSGQGTGSDATAGVFYATRGSTIATAITGLDTTGKTVSQDTRMVQMYNGTLYASVDTKGGSNSARSYIGTLGTPPATSLYNSGSGPTELNGFGNSGGTGKITITAGNKNTVDAVSAAVNLSPENFFFANASTLYVADSGAPKNDSNATKAGVDLGLGGLQKWTNSAADGSGVWTLDYTLSQGLNLVPNATDGGTSGTTGLYGLAGKVVNGQVELFATNYTIGDTDQTYLYGITDLLSATTSPTGEQFAVLATASADENFKGVSFAPSAVPLPAAAWLLLSGLGGLGALTFRRRRESYAGAALSA